ncbi:MAG: hypothetical protein Q8O67_31310 [Deltaproteobacteria bacterium]|nr:hypothetical protein [Deltaproteobacteria bacterium]
MFVWSTLFVVFIALLIAAVVFATLYPARLRPHHGHHRVTNRHRFRVHT